MSNGCSYIFLLEVHNTYQKLQKPLYKSLKFDISSYKSFCCKHLSLLNFVVKNTPICTCFNRINSLSLMQSQHKFSQSKSCINTCIRFIFCVLLNISVGLIIAKLSVIVFKLSSAFLFCGIFKKVRRLYSKSI